MYPAKFEYVAATSLQQALEVLQREDGDAKLLAGGHSLLPLMKLRLAQPRVLVDIGRIPGLSYIRREGDELAIGPMVTYRDLERSEEVHRHVPVLAEAASEVGDPQVRARGTLVGSLAHADPSGDMPGVVLALGATVRTLGPSGERTLPIDGFFVDLLTTALEENEIITEVRVPILGPRTGAAYLKFDQPASHYALTGVCAVVTLSESGRVEAVRVGITGVGPAAYRPTAVEDALRGQEPTEEQIASASQTAADGVDVQGDIHAGVNYRAHLARVYTRRALTAAVGRASAAS